MKTIKVTVCVAHDNNGYIAQANDMAAMWARGTTIDEAIAEYKKSYDGMLEMFAPSKWDFHVMPKKWDFHVISKGE